nr:hypothetical protein [uncultured Rhodopila sp.]
MTDDNGHAPPPGETPQEQIARLQIVLSMTVAMLRDISGEIEALAKMLLQEKRK